MMGSFLVRALATWLVLLLVILSRMASASDDAGCAGSAPCTPEHLTAGELSEMPPAARRALFQESAPGIPMPINFGTDELEKAQKQISDQYYHGMADTLRALGDNATALPPIYKPVGLAARGAAIRFGKLSRATEFGIKPYGRLRSLLQGTGLRAHHLIEQRFAGLMGQDAGKMRERCGKDAGKMRERCGKDAGKMLSIAVTFTEHQSFTNAWRQVIPYGQGTASATRQQVLDAARQIYAQHPELLKALGL